MVWEWKGIRLDTKLKVYKAVLLSTFLYACETWTVYQRHAKRLNHFHLSCLRNFLKIRWQDKIPDTEVLKKAKMQSVHTLLKLAQLRLIGHITRMPHERLLPKKVFMENCRKESAHKVSKRNDTKTHLKLRLRISVFQLSPGNRLHRIEQSGVASSTKELHKCESKRICEAERKRKKEKKEPRIHQQTRHSPNSPALFGTDS